MVRLLLDHVVVNVQGDSEQVDVALHWAGGFVSVHRLLRSVSSYKQLSNYRALCERIDALRSKRESLAKIAEHLNQEGFYPPKRTSRFSKRMLSKLLAARGLHGPPRRRPRAMADPEVLQEHEHWLTDLARELGIPFGTLHKWRRVGWVHGRKVPVAGGRWALWADDEERSRLRNLRSYRRQWPNPRYPVELTTPKPPGKNA